MTVNSPLSAGAMDVFRKQREKALAKKLHSVCRCGHSSNVHLDLRGDGVLICRPGRMHCSCKHIDPVLETNNLRLFRFMTTGHGMDHALSKGICAVLEKREEDLVSGDEKRELNPAEIKWIQGEFPLCDICHEVAPEPVPVSILTETKVMIETNGDAGKILCQGCFNKWYHPTA